MLTPQLLGIVMGPSWRPLHEDRHGALELLDAAASDARAAGHPEEAEALAFHRKEIEEGKTAGGLLRGPDGQVWGIAVWTVLRDKGRRISPVYLAKERQNPAGWTQFLSFLLESPDPSGPVLLFNSPLPGFAESGAVPFLAARGFHLFHRYNLAYPPGGALPAEPPRPMVGGRLRTLSSADLEPLAVLSAACYAHSVDRFLFGEETEPLTAARSLLGSLFQGQFGTFVPDASFGLEVDGTLRGATVVTRRPAYYLLADVEVHPSVQGQGHARRLIRATLQALSTDTETPLALSVTQQNGVAFQLYRNLGFVVRQGPFTFWADTATLGVSPPSGAVGDSGPAAR